MNVNSSNSSTLKNSQALLLLAVITIVGAALRLYQLGYESLWYDELASWQQSRKANLAQVFEGMRNNVHPPGWTMFLYFVQKTIGDTEFALRLPSAIVGIASIPAIFLLGRKIAGNSTGLIAAVLMATMWAPINYSQEARAYALLIFVSIVSLHLLLHIVETLENDGRPYLTTGMYIFLAIFASYLHYSGLILVAAQAAWVTCRTFPKRRESLWLLTIYLLAAAAYLPWALELISDLRRSKFWISGISWPVEVLSYFFYRGKTYLPLVGIIVVFISYPLFHFLTKLISDRSLDRKSAIPALLAIFALPYAAFLIKSLISTPIIMPRYILISLPAAYLLMAIGVTKLVSRDLFKLAVIGVFAAASLIELFDENGYFNKLQKTDYRGVVNSFIESPGNAQSDSTIISYRGRNGFRYYLQRFGSSQTLTYSVRIREALGANVHTNERARLEEFLSNLESSDLWIMAGFHKVPKNVLTTIEQRFELIQQQKFKGSQLKHYRKKTS